MSNQRAIFLKASAQLYHSSCCFHLSFTWNIRPFVHTNWKSFLILKSCSENILSHRNKKNFSSDCMVRHHNSNETTYENVFLWQNIQQKFVKFFLLFAQWISILIAPSSIKCSTAIHTHNSWEEIWTICKYKYITRKYEIWSYVICQRWPIIHPRRIQST